MIKKISLLFFLVSSIFAYANNELSVDLSSGKGSHEGVVIAAITNNLNHDVEVLKWGTPFEEELTSNIFTVERNGNVMNYMGKLVKRGHPTANDYITLSGGETREVSISLPSNYDMKERGNYNVSFHGNFKFKNLTANKKSLSAISVPSNVIINYTLLSKVAERKQPVFYQGCSESQIDSLNEAHDAAIAMSEESMNVLVGAPDTTDAERYTTWFGSADAQRKVQVQTNMTEIYSALYMKNIVFDCTCNKNYYAYVHPYANYIIYLCNKFWSAPVTGTDSQAGTIIHETSHFKVVASTDDNAYGHTNAQELAQSSPNNAIINADSHEYFAENTPELSMGDISPVSNPSPNPSWTPEYVNKADVTQELCIADASKLTVHINGEVEENFDYIYVNSERYTGVLSEEITVSGSCITARFISDYSVTKSGVTVSIEAGSGGKPSSWRPKYLNNVDLTQELCIAGASSLTVYIDGEAETNYDYIYVNGKKYTGVLSEVIIASGPCITARFTSDGSITKSGVTVSIKAGSGSGIPSSWIPEYANNADVTQELCIDGASSLLVLINGEVEVNYDYIYVNGERYTGVLSEKIIASGPCITARFTSDYSITKSGVTVSIEKKIPTS